MPLCLTLDVATEAIRLRGYATVESGYSPARLAALSAAFDRAREAMEGRHGGPAALEAIGEQHMIRLPLAYEPIFLELATHPDVLDICRRLMGSYIVLNQQNGVVNPAHGTYSQGRYHRDLPYQHFVASRPLGVSALFCLDPFTADNGATRVIPASQTQEAFPADAVVDQIAVQVVVPAGSFILMDAMVFHAGGSNRTAGDRRAVNHVFTVPPFKQHISLPDALGPDFTADPAIRKLLGYEVRVPTSVAAYYASRPKLTH
jgi:ectoine hydroxylase-related dioxygenase (phytanoyl-CoA dioxygenase family)